MQLGLMHETINDALREVVQSAGGFKVVAVRLWPDMPPDHAAGKLRDCVNSDRREHLTPGQVCLLLKIGRDAGCHAAMHFMARYAGYADPQPIEPEDERAALQREYVEAAKSMARMAERIERLNAPSLSRAA
jgi:hypothetical protein